ncbi:hypothetical protein L1987_01351 [Smallanthus sonchifolius]|uniref:Uncharacterized protein n=1 Tax=Smallanthus sonchifolius TaxID=185202 RepID=A0ACB9K4V3_9ASTR|nr:hypothetical protein L1987_01351 [Smallanthus sonchifolius]
MASTSASSVQKTFNPPKSANKVGLWEKPLQNIKKTAGSPSSLTGSQGRGRERRKMEKCSERSSWPRWDGVEEHF